MDDAKQGTIESFQIQIKINVLINPRKIKVSKQ